MSEQQSPPIAEGRQQVRCAVYTRKSTNEGLDQDFNTLEAQREAGEMIVSARRQEGWVLLPTRYDDGGYSGGDMDRPALQRLLRDIKEGRVDCVIVYKVDRLSRSMKDFMQMMTSFEESGIGFHSVTQDFSSTTSMGRLTLNILFSFAQFERDMISERTRDKMSAARKKGKWLGSRPPHGYNGDRDRMRLVINPMEADHVRAIFDLYLRHRSAAAVAEIINERGWRRKAYVVQRTKQRKGGEPWTKQTLTTLLRDPIYIGKVRYKGGRQPKGAPKPEPIIYEGEQEAIVDEITFSQAQRLLDARGRGRGERRTRNPDYLLSGLIQCGRCDAPFTTSAGKGQQGGVYRYYLCSRKGVCDHPRLPAPELEQAVVKQLRLFCADDAMRGELIRQLREESAEALAELRAQEINLEAQIDALNQEDVGLLEALRVLEGQGRHLVLKRGGELQAQRSRLYMQIDIIHGQTQRILSVQEQIINGVGILSVLEEAWESMETETQRHLTHLLIERVIIDEPKARLEVHFHELDGALQDLAS